MNKSIEKKTPQIYCYTAKDANGKPHNEGYCKIGYTEREDVEKRIKEQTKTVGLIPEIHWREKAFLKSGNQFNDKLFHYFLETRGYKKIPKKEWFCIEPEKAKEELFEFLEFMNGDETKKLNYLYELRNEQVEAVTKTINYIKEHKDSKFLWNAKPRFGKTLTAYDFCVKIDAKKILVVTGRPVIAHSWYDDYEKYFHDKYKFLARTSELKKEKDVFDCDKFFKKTNITNESFICFLSLQDLKSSNNFKGGYEKLQEISKINWDVLIIDEAHEGINTDRSDDVFNNINRKFTLHLTGTAFKDISNGKFNDESMFSWTYVDEQKAKEEWNDYDQRNPYTDLPKLVMKSYRLQNIFSDEIQQDNKINNDIEYGYKLNTLFSCYNNKFIYDEYVDKFLNTLSSDPKYPFAEEYIDIPRHSFWLLYRVESAELLAKKLSQHPVFKHYEIIIAAGKNKQIDAKNQEYDIKGNKKSFELVRNAIKTYKSKGKKGTITLSVGQLTTGVTIPEWSAVFILSDQDSPERYMQAIFRAQNPFAYIEEGNYYRKEIAYVYDFNQQKALTMMERFATDLFTNTAGGIGNREERLKNIEDLIKYFPILGEDESGKLSQLSSESILTIPLKLNVEEVIKSKFMSNALLDNISNIFRAQDNSDIIHLLNKIKKVDAPNNIIDTEEYTEPDENELEQSRNKWFEDNNDFQDDVSENNENIETSNIESTATDLNKNFQAGEKNEEQKLSEMENDTDENILNEEKENYIQKLKNYLNRLIDKNLTLFDKYIIDKNLKQKALVDKIKIEFKRKLNNIIDEQNYIDIITEMVEKPEKEDDIIEMMNVVIDDFIKFSREIFNNYQKKIDSTIINIEKEKKDRENEIKIRNNLRSFTRTIPSFLMAYGNQNTCLENFEKNIPEKVFKEVTGITIAEFILLRNGGHYKNESGVEKYFAGHVFNKLIFDESIKEFLRKKDALADYFDENQKEDIFDYIPPQQTNQIYTPKKIVKQMIAHLEEEEPGCFDDPNKTFIDMYMKSGLFITEIVKKLYNNEKMKKAIPDDNERLKHIFEHQVYGIAPTEIIYNIAINFIFGSEKTKAFSRSNFAEYDILKDAQEGPDKVQEKLDKLFDKNNK